MVGATSLISPKLFFLLLLVAQNTSKTLLLRFAVGAGKPAFLYSAAVVGTEAMKAMASALWVLRSGGSPTSIVTFLRSEWRIFVRVMVPAGIYNAQQMLEFVALSRLEAPVFSVIVQTKLLTTALFSWLIMGRQLRGVQIIALVLLTVGVVLAQMRDGQKR
jgi:UDP-sugar transporter A1/2/3